MAAIMLLKGKDGALTTCINFRKLNKQTLRHAYPLPNLKDTMHAMSSVRYFSSLDIMSASWNVPFALKNPKDWLHNFFQQLNHMKSPTAIHIARAQRPARALEASGSELAKASRRQQQQCRHRYGAVVRAVGLESGFK